MATGGQAEGHARRDALQVTSPSPQAPPQVTHHSVGAPRFPHSWHPAFAEPEPDSRVLSQRLVTGAEHLRAWGQEGGSQLARLSVTLVTAVVGSGVAPLSRTLVRPREDSPGAGRRPEP